MKDKTNLGFTLTELMIVVVIIGILAAIAVFSYKRYIIRARASEAEGYVTNIKMLQEAYFSNFGQYANVSNGVEAWDPTTCGSEGGCTRIPGRNPLLWDRNAVDPDWAFLGFSPTGTMMFQVQTIAGFPGQPAPALQMSNTNIDLSNFVDTTNHWFIVRAMGNGDEDDTVSMFGVTNSYNGIVVVKPEE